MKKQIKYMISLVTGILLIRFFLQERTIEPCPSNFDYGCNGI